MSQQVILGGSGTVSAAQGKQSQLRGGWFIQNQCSMLGVAGAVGPDTNDPNNSDNSSAGYTYYSNNWSVQCLGYNGGVLSFKIGSPSNAPLGQYIFVNEFNSFDGGAWTYPFYIGQDTCTSPQNPAPSTGPGPSQDSCG